MKPKFAVIGAAAREPSLLVEISTHHADGSFTGWVVNGSWEGTFTKDSVYVRVKDTKYPAHILWTGASYPADWDTRTYPFTMPEKSVEARLIKSMEQAVEHAKREAEVTPQKVRLVAVTRPEQYLVDEGIATPSDLIAYCARVSNPTNQLNVETADRLVGWLVKKAHWSPFEMVNAVVEVNETRDITRQLLRHRSFSFQEFSQRYAVVADLKPAIAEARLQDTANRQNSIEVDDPDLQAAWAHQQQEVWRRARKAYEWALKQGVAKEVARKVLPEGLTMSRLYVNGTLRSWIHYLALRTGNGTQKEHINMARLIAQAIAEAFPEITSFVQ
jgi:thymidylate synthase (FAD)